MANKDQIDRVTVSSRRRRADHLDIEVIECVVLLRSPAKKLTPALARAAVEIAGLGGARCIVSADGAAYQIAPSGRTRKFHFEF
jgi:hypothetical protein